MGYGVTSLITIVIDSAPPQRVSSTPENNQMYSSLPTVSIQLTDAGSGVSEVLYSDTGGNIELALTSGDIHNGLWMGDHSNPPQSGTHSFTFTFYDSANPINKGTYSGSYMIYSQLQGVWYVKESSKGDTAWQEVTSTSTVYLSEQSIDFRFEKTAGIDDAQIACTMKITSGGTGSTTLTNVATGEWSGTYDFQEDGTYVVEMKADDGQGTPVLATLVNIGTGDEGGIYSDAFSPTKNYAWVFIMLGSAFIIYGLRVDKGDFL